MKNSHIILTTLLILLLASPVLAAEDTRIKVQFQDLGISTQSIVVFDDIGDDVIHSNTSSTITLDINESSFYTIQLQPSHTNMEPKTMLDNFMDFIARNWLAVFLIFAILIAITKKRR
ncbi:hypothetical protein F1737_04380 [Methanoplanus sp. FWC-SCC4]|uniref:Uncharacterized protein n=1 Tax=Methanochimaera problematica TaxID=2609417 RepID=A0AA97FCH7_9EURY|nr:hypothetical protein [Methanoplanus sp. FWC-SCC4]WOF15992.1 hypothetical protein F1737_04380 [Methanoplanus sp. FWC-SCC4]